MTLSVIVVAAGSGERLGASVPKSFVSLAGSTLLEHALAPLAARDDIDEVIVVAPEHWIAPATQLASGVLGDEMSLHVVSGGATRTASVRAGLAVLSPGTDWVLIHDAARPQTPGEVFERVIAALAEGHHGVIPVIPVVDTIVPVTDSGQSGPAYPRSALGAVQTPQGFAAETLLAAYATFDGEATDDAEVLRRAVHDVVTVPGHSDSTKVTYPSDLVALEARLGDAGGVRVGTGVDVHPFDPDKRCVLGGLEFPEVAGFTGHSDGDVIVHAITDALLAAASLGDLGTHFGVDRPEYAGVDSTDLLVRAIEMLRVAGYRPQSVSVQYIGNHPRIGPVRERMSKRLSELVGAPVHVAGTTTDGLGLTGRGEGAAASAVALVTTAH